MTASNVRTALFTQREPWRLNTAVLLSLILHALLLSITLGGQTFGLPGLNFPWKERRLGANDLRIMLAPTQSPTGTSPQRIPDMAPAPADTPAMSSNVPAMAMPPPAVARGEVTAVLIPPAAIMPAPAIVSAPPPEPATTARTRPDVNLPIAPNAPPIRTPANSVAQIAPALASDIPVPDNAAEAAQKQIDQDTQQRALEQARLEREQQNAERVRQAEQMAAAQREAARQAQLRQDAARAEQATRSEAARVESERQELALLESQRREALQKERTRQDEKAQQESARQEIERAEAARLEAVLREAAKQQQTRQAQLEAAAQEAAKIEAARREAEKQEAARQDALRQEAARQAAAKENALAQESARQAASKQDAARQEQAKQDQAKQERAEQEAKREERLRAIGKQLDAEAAQREALNRPSQTLPTASSLRRGWLFGRANPNADLVQYGDAMSRKIEMNMTFDMVREVVKQRHTQPTVTVAIRADGSVEKITFEVSSGVPAIDEAIRKVIASQAPYSAFLPAMARQYDVIEIRRTWIFDTAIRLQ